MKRFFSTTAHCFYLGWSEAWAQKAELVGIFITYAVLIGIWSSIWLMVPDIAIHKMGLTHEQIIWYFATTELIVFSLAHMYKDIEGDIKGGLMGAFLLRPVGYVTLKVAEWMGFACLKLAVFGIGISIVVFAITGYFPFSIEILPVVALTLCLSVVIWLIIQTMIGLSAAWFHSARPVFMVVQKGLFVLGGMVLPVVLYPNALRYVVEFLPFQAILYAPASLLKRYILIPAEPHAAF